MKLEQAKEPVFYPNETVGVITAPFNLNATLRIPSGQKVEYRADEDGIVEVTDTFDQYGESMYATCKMVLSKEVFIAAYNAYIR